MLLGLSGVFLLLLDASLICGQNTTHENKTAFEDGNSTYEDQENFQNQERYHVFNYCFEEALRQYGQFYCWAKFNESMILLGEENWCNVKMIVRSYHELTDCLETSSSMCSCYYPNHVVEQLFVMIHKQYFHSCSDEELPDAPAGVVLTATLLPIVLIPFMVYIVVLKSSLRD
nr:receptor activity-modifying protein 2-like [Misgurnus anguillicaudatus]